MNPVDQFLSHVKRRRWEHMRSKWASHIPYLDTPGCIPPNTVADVSGLDAIAQKLAADANAEITKCRASHYTVSPTFTPIDEQLTGMYEAVFRESLFLLHKARHVVGAAEFHAQAGLRTWSLADAYQGAFFAAKAALGFVGISFAEHNNKAIAIDLFPNPVTSADQYSYCAFYYLGNRLEHRPVWEIFQRLLAISTVEVWPKNITNKLKSIESNNFAKQRNNIHYKNNGWILNDLHEFDHSKGFGNSSVWTEGLDFGRDDISLAVALCVLKLGMLLVQDIELFSKKLTPEMELFAACVEKGRHPMYGELLLSK